MQKTVKEGKDPRDFFKIHSVENNQKVKGPLDTLENFLREFLNSLIVPKI